MRRRISTAPDVRVALARRERRQHLLATRRQRRGLAGDALHDAATAGRDAGAERADVGAAGGADDEQLFTRPQRAQHDRSGRRCRRGSGSRCGSSRWRGRRCCAAATSRSGHGLRASRRNLGLVLLQAFERRSAARRHAGANLGIIGPARALDRSYLCAARLLGRRRFRSGCCGRLRRRLGSGRCFGLCRFRLGRLRFGRLRFGGRCFALRRCSRLDCANRGLASGRQARHVLLQTLIRFDAAGRHARAVRHEIRAARGADGALLSLGRRLPECACCSCEERCREQRLTR